MISHIKEARTVGLDEIRTTILHFLDSNQMAWNVSLPLGGLDMAYEWDESSARKLRLIKLASVCALTATALSVPVALFLNASPL